MNRKRRSKGRSGTNTNTVVAALAAGALVLLALALVYAGLRSADYREAADRARDLQQQLAAARQEADTARAEAESARKQFADFLQGNLPAPYLKIEPDKVIPLDHPLTRNIVFSEVVREGRTVVEFRLLLENRGLDHVLPELRILAFDKFGLQVGTGKFGESAAWKDFRRRGLPPGESAVLTGSLNLFADADPHFFFLMPES
jgi:hypothetical protein